MATSITSIGWLPLFRQARKATSFLSSFFTLKPGGVFNGESVTIDIERLGEDVAVVVTHGTGPRLNDMDIFTTKTFTPPAYSEAMPFNVHSLLNRMVGVDPYTAAYQDVAGQLVAYFVSAFAAMDNKIKRAVEIQAAQILQTGILNLTDANGDVEYTLSFSPKATHFPTVTTTWSDTGATPLSDLEALAEVVRADGLVDPSILIMGSEAMRAFKANTEVLAQLDNRRINIGEIAPRMVGRGATFQGTVWVGDYQFTLWTYPQVYKDPETLASLKYVDNDKVIMMSEDTRLDMVSAIVPLPIGPDPRVASLMPGRMVSEEDNLDATPNVYATPNGKQIMGELESRTLLIPVQIDGYGCLITTAP